MTPKQAAWLRKLRDEGPQQTRPRFARLWHQHMGYSTTATFDMGVKGRRWTHMITTEGLSALSAYEEKAK